MIKVDFHVHTIPTIKDPEFSFDIQTLNQYVNEMALDCIAITNHNCFNEEQFNMIKNNINAKVFPGMEVDIENAHLLVICNYNNIEELTKASEMLKKIIIDEESYISFEQFITIFPSYKDFILIPHYKKKPRMSETTIKKFEGLIKCGEVPNAKKFLSIKKKEEMLIPVVFSDYRPFVKNPFPNRYTYIDCENNELSNIRCAIEDRTKVSVSIKNMDNEIEYLPDGSTISNKLNVILGTRTSGKTYNIEKIKEAFDNDSCLYVPQFSLIGDAEDAKFSEIIKKECSSIADNFYSKFKPLVRKLLSIDIKTLENNIEEQLEGLIEYAKNADIDSFAKTKIFSEVNFQIDDNKQAVDIINALKTLYNNEWEKEIVEKYIDKDKLKGLIIELVAKQRTEAKDIKLKEFTNQIIDKIKKDLTKESSANATESMDLINIFKYKKIIEKTNIIFPLLKEEKELEVQKLPLFEVSVKKVGYDTVSEVKDNLGTNVSLRQTFENNYKKDNLYEYIWDLKEKGFSINDICKSFIKITYDVQNQIGEEPSGGEKAEFNLLKEINNAYKYDVLLIDEPEASFDNPFINDNIVDLIKNICEKTTVCITTHNSTLAMMLNPDKIIFTENIKGNHKVYYGTMGDKTFKSTNGDEIISYEKILEVLEAGKTIYEEKGRKYESFKDRK